MLYDMIVLVGVFFYSLLQNFLHYFYINSRVIYDIFVDTLANSNSEIMFIVMLKDFSETYGYFLGFLLTLSLLFLLVVMINVVFNYAKSNQTNQSNKNSFSKKPKLNKLSHHKNIKYFSRLRFKK